MTREQIIAKALYELDEEVYKDSKLKSLLEHCKLYQGCADPRVYERGKLLLREAKCNEQQYKTCSKLLIDALYI